MKYNISFAGYNIFFSDVFMADSYKDICGISINFKKKEIIHISFGLTKNIRIGKDFYEDVQCYNEEMFNYELSNNIKLIPFSKNTSQETIDKFIKDTEKLENEMFMDLPVEIIAFKPSNAIRCDPIRYDLSFVDRLKLINDDLIEVFRNYYLQSGTKHPAYSDQHLGLVP